MCYFDQLRFVCGDWTWGQFRQHCYREYRVGEVCGMKLIMSTIPVDQKCKICERIEKKVQRLQAENERFNRWNGGGGKFRASAKKSADVIRSLESEIHELGEERSWRLRAIGSNPTYDPSENSENGLSDSDSTSHHGGPAASQVSSATSKSTNTTPVNHSLHTHSGPTTPLLKAHNNPRSFRHARSFNQRPMNTEIPVASTARQPGPYKSVLGIKGTRDVHMSILHKSSIGVQKSVFARDNFSKQRPPAYTISRDETRTGGRLRCHHLTPHQAKIRQNPAAEGDGTVMMPIAFYPFDPTRK